MSKTFKTTETTYHITALYFDREQFAPVTVEFDSVTKNARTLAKYVCDTYGVKSQRDVNIADIQQTTEIVAITVDSDLRGILKACEAAGIAISYHKGSDTEDAEE